MVGPPPALAAVRGAVRAALADLVPGDVVLVACSGGTDSLALAVATAFCAPRLGLRAGAVVVDHGWRTDSALVAARAAGVCAELGLDPVEVVRVDPCGPGGPEAAARDARYAALDQAAVRHRAVAVLVAHTADDQAETVLLGLARGSGARSLAGMAARRGLLLRPLLGLSRDVTADACAAAGLVPDADPANADPAYARVRVRAAMDELERILGPGLRGALSRSAEMLREDADALDDLAARLLGQAREGADPGGPGSRAGARDGGRRAGEESSARDGGLGGTARDGGLGGTARDGGVCLDVAVLAAAPTAVRRRALLAALREAGSPSGSVGRRHVLAVDALVTAWRGQGPVDLPGRVVALRRCGRLLVRRAVTGEQGDRSRLPTADAGAASPETDFGE